MWGASRTQPLYEASTNPTSLVFLWAGLAAESQSFPEQSKCPQKRVKMVGGATTFSPCDHDRALWDIKKLQSIENGRLYFRTKHFRKSSSSIQYINQYAHLVPLLLAQSFILNNLADRQNWPGEIRAEQSTKSHSRLSRRTIKPHLKNYKFENRAP